MSATRLLVGLGNPGAEYARTRHNVGHMVLDRIAEQTGGTFKAARRGKAKVVEGYLGAPGTGARTILAKPGTYMNLSGGPVRALADFYGVAPEDVVVVHDDVDIPFDTIRLKRGGGEGGHNGLRDISKALGTKDYLRVRVGVGRPSGRRDTADHVLAPFTATERETLPILVDDAAEAATRLILEGLEPVQQHFHARGDR